MEGTGRSSSRRRAVARIALSVLLGVWFAITLTFLLFHTQTGSSPRFEGVPSTLQAQLREEFGLDRPVPDRYLSFMGDVARGDLGRSFANQEPVAEFVRPAIVHSLVLMGSAMFIAFVVARVLAIAAVRRPNGRFDRSVLGVSATLASIPFHYVFVALVIIGVHSTGLFPPVGFRSDPTATGWAAVGDAVRHSALLALAIAASLLGRFTLMIRARILDRLEWTGETPRSRRARRRAFRAMSGGALRDVAGLVGFTVSALIVIESIPAWPGAGGQLSTAILNADYPVVQGIFLILTVFAVALVCAVRRPWPVASPGETLSSPIQNRAVRAGVVLTGAWIAFALLSSNLEMAVQDRSRLGFVAWTTAFGVVVGAVTGMIAGASPRVLGSVLGWLVDAVAAVPFLLALFALIVVQRGADASKVAIALIGAGLVARPVARAWQAAGAARRLRALAAGAASLASFVFFAAAVLPVSWISEGNEIGLGWSRLGTHALNAATPVLGLGLVAHGLSARRRSLFRPASVS